MEKFIKRWFNDNGVVLLSQLENGKFLVEIRIDNINSKNDCFENKEYESNFKDALDLFLKCKELIKEPEDNRKFN